MTPTTLRTIGADFVSVIQGVTPSHAIHRRAAWHNVDRMELVPGEVLRLFHCVWEATSPVEDGIYGSGVEHETFVRVYTNYRGLREDEAPEMQSDDGRQLWVTLEARCDPVVDGLVQVSHEGFETEEDEPGHAWGAHVFHVRMLLSHTA